MTREEAGSILKNAAWLGSNADRERIEEAVRVAVEALSEPEAVQCKDCKYASPNGEYGCTSYHYRRYEKHDMKPDDFCSRAERRTSG